MALATNIDLLRVGSESLRGTGARARAQMTAMTIAQGHESARFVPQGVPTFTFIMGIIVAPVRSSPPRSATATRGTR